MSLEAIQEEIAITGGLITISIFEEKLMKNFMIINSRLRKLEGLFELDQKTKNIEKQLKFLNMKVETIVEKLPRDGGAITRNDVKTIARQQVEDLLNSSDEKVTKSKFSIDIAAQISKLKEEFAFGSSSFLHKNSNDKKDVRTSFTAGQALKEGTKPPKKISKQFIPDCLDQNQMEIVNNIIDQECISEKNEKEQKNEVTQLRAQLQGRIEDLYHKIDELKLGKGYSNYVQSEAARFHKYEQYEQKSRSTTRKQKEKPMQLDGIRQQNVKGQIMKSCLYTALQKAELAKEEITKHQLLYKKNIYTNGTLLDKKLSKDDTKVQLHATDDQFKRSKSIKKLDRMERRLKVDDSKQINGVLRQIQLRIQGRVSHEIFMGFIKDLQEKLEILKITKDQSTDMQQVKKSIYLLDNKIQSIINYVQISANQEDALLVKKQWTCISCDKNLEKYAGKIGQHLNWDNMSTKKMSPTRVGAFGQIGQLNSKIRNLMENHDAQQ